MKAIVIHTYGGPDVLKYEDYPDPVPGKGDVLVRVVASSVNPFDFKLRSGSLKEFIPLNAVADTVSGSTANAVLAKIKHGGIFASVLGPPSEAANYPTVEVKTMQVTADSAVLSAMAEAVQKGALSIPLGQKFSLKDAGKAHAAAEKGSTGKILLLV
jgi:NADPH:quinone reductase-like Zn-dependent oxidoreductase